MFGSRCPSCGFDMKDNKGNFCPKCGEAMGLSFMTPEQTQVEPVYSGERVRFPTPEESERRLAIMEMPHAAHYHEGTKVTGRLLLHPHGVAFISRKKIEPFFIPLEYIESVYWEDSSTRGGAPNYAGDIFQLNLYENNTLVFKIAGPKRWAKKIDELLLRKRLYGN